jgi:hypothetical protein
MTAKAIAHALSAKPDWKNSRWVTDCPLHTGKSGKGKVEVWDAGEGTTMVCRCGCATAQVRARIAAKP